MQTATSQLARELAFVLQRVVTLSPDRKRKLVGRYEAGTLTEADKRELEAHIRGTIPIVEEEVMAGKALMKALGGAVV